MGCDALRYRRGRVWVAIVLAAAASAPLLASGQGITTASLQGSVSVEGGGAPDGTRITVRNAATGFKVEATAVRGRFAIYGLEVGGPYSLELRRIGYHAQQRDSLFLHLGEPLELHFVLRPTENSLEEIQVLGETAAEAAGDGGTVTTVPDSLVHHLPTLNRNLYDFVHLAPQVSTKTGFAAGGLSAGGVGMRYNNFLVDGVPQRSVSGGQPPEFSGGKSLPFEAISEYQILVAPFDVRYGDFAGGMVNLVTRAGTNDVRGSAFASVRNDALARGDPERGVGSYEQYVTALSLGAPLWRNRVHLFAAAELQRYRSPAPGPYVGQPVQALPPVPVSDADVARLSSLLAAYGLEAGTGGSIDNRNPLTNLFARVDVALPRWNSRAVVSWNDARSENLTFSRLTAGVFPLSTQVLSQKTAIRTVAAQLHSALPRAAGGHNLLVLSHRTTSFGPILASRQPLISVRVPSTTGGSVAITTGSPAPAHDNSFGPFATGTTIRNDLTLPVGADHALILGAEAEWFHVRRRGVPNAYGTWTFSSLDSLAAGVAERFEVARDYGSATVPAKGVYAAVYLGDEWHPHRALRLTLGLRADLLSMRGNPPYNREIDSLFDQRTDVVPKTRVAWSPRLGFTWAPDESGVTRLRGGVGLFAGRPPIAWLHAPLHSYGVGISTLSCGRLPNDNGPPPAFVADYRQPPLECANGTGIGSVTRGNAELLSDDVGMVQTIRGVFAYERRMPARVYATAEAVLTQTISDLVFVNLNLAGPQGVDRYGRVLYGSFGPTGIPSVARRGDYPAAVTELRAVSGTRAQQYSLRVERKFTAGSAIVGQYTHSRVRDIQTPLRVNVAGSVNWASRVVSGRHDDLRRGISLNDIPHRIVLAGVARAPWSRWRTEVALYYLGESGSPFTYVAWGAVRRGDLNADGSNANDPIYVPQSASDTSEMRFALTTRVVALPDGGTRTDTITAQEQAQAFDRFIDASRCLRQRRGSILERNSCREPWSHRSVLSLRQRIPLTSDGIEVQLDIYNLLNLLNRNWGRARVAAPQILEHVSQTSGPASTAQPVFRYDTAAPRWTVLPGESAYQLQFALRYRF